MIDHSDLKPGSFIRQLGTLIYRNLLLKKQQPSILFSEVFMPLMFTSLLFAFKLNQPQNQPAVTSYTSHSLAGLTPGQPTHLFVYPDQGNVSAMAADVVTLLAGDGVNVTLRMFNSSTEAESAYSMSSRDSVVYGLTFDDPTNLYSYTLRPPYDSQIQASNIYGSLGTCRTELMNISLSSLGCPANLYATNFFLSLQSIIDTYLVQLDQPAFRFPTVSVRLFPKPEFVAQVAGTFQLLAALYCLIGFTGFLATILSILVYEKEIKIRETMRIMGMRDSAYWSSFFLMYFAHALILAAVITIIAVIGGLFNNGHYIIYFILIGMLGMSMTTLASMLVPFFNKSQIAGSVAGILPMLLYLFYLAVAQTRFMTGPGGPISQVPAWVQGIFCLLSPVAFALSLDQVLYLDLRQGGASFSKFGLGQLPLNVSVPMLAFDIILYAFLAFYFDSVIPGEYGSRRNVFFLFSPSYWRSADTQVDPQHLETANPLSVKNHEPIEDELRNKDCVRLLGITKTYTNKQNKKTNAVDEFSLSIYEGQITCLLGHNGAGKSTLINMLTGLITPTCGTACIYNKFITKSSDLDRIRQMTGYCPQENTLYVSLTCRQHFYIYASFKGIPPSQVDQLAEESLKSLNMSDKADELTRSLSGGQKRKLCVALALLGAPRIVFLDEPTSGMDPESRRYLWTFLKSHKQGRVIILTTHFMDEADILSDRKAFISHGRLQCVGSSLFLKSKFGLGYHLSVTLQPDVDVATVMQFFNQFNPNASISQHYGNQLVINLPLSTIERFPAMFAELESVSGGVSKSESLGIKDYGISMTTLEEVFLKLENIDDETTDVLTDDIIPILNSGSELKRNVSASERAPVVQQYDSATRRAFLALVLVRLNSVMRNKLLFFARIILPCILFLISVLLSKFNVFGGVTLQTYESLPLNSSLYSAVAGAVNSSSPSTIYSTDLSNGSDVSGFISSLASLTSVRNSNYSNLLSILPHHLGLDLRHLNTSPSSGSFELWYNDTATHSLPVLLNLLSNSLYSLRTNQSAITPSSPNISVSSQLWPDLDPRAQVVDTLFMALIIIYAVVVPYGSFAKEIVKERRDKIRGHLRISGVSINLYWGHLLFSHLTQLSIILAFLIIVTGAVQIPSLSYPGAFFAFILIVVIGIFGVTLFTYCLSFMFDKEDTAQSIVSLILQMSFLIPKMVMLPLRLIPTVSSDVVFILHIVFTILFPTYAVGDGISRIQEVYIVESSRQRTLSPVIGFSAAFEQKEMIVCLIVVIINSFVYYFLLRLIDVRSTGGNFLDILGCGGSGGYNYSHGYTTLSELAIPTDEDEDVMSERRRVASLTQSETENQVVTLKGVRREFTKAKSHPCASGGSKENKIVAVNNSSFSIGPGEIFGLLGPNGAGKTTTINMIVAEVGLTAGEINIAEHNIQSSLSGAFQSTGYCPQHDALWEDITLREHINCYARLNRLKDENLDKWIDFYLHSLRIEEHADKVAKKLSGGTKRKLSFILSILGNTKLVLMDEPSTGMDPGSKRFLWDTITEYFDGSKSGAILTTHYMDEADTLSSRIGIMINGELKCIGASQHLKNRFGTGYLLEIKLQRNEKMTANMVELKSFLLGRFPSCEETECFSERVTFTIPQNEVTSLSSVFKTLEEASKTFSFEEYSFGQASLEQVFLKFARHQKSLET